MAPKAIVCVLTPLPTVTADGATAELTNNLGRLFVVLVEARGIVMEHPDLRRLLFPRSTDGNALYLAVRALRKALGQIGMSGLVLTKHGVGYAFDRRDVEVDLYLFRDDVSQAEEFFARRKFTQAIEAAARATERWLGYPPIVMPQTRKALRRAFAIQIEACAEQGDTPQETTVWELAHAALRPRDSEALTREVERDRDAAAKPAKRQRKKKEGDGSA